MADFYDRLERAKKTLTAVEGELEENRRSSRDLEDHGEFTQHLHSQLFRLCERVSNCWRGSGAVKALNDYSSHNEHFYCQAMDTIRRGLEQLQQHKRVLGNQYDDAQRQYGRAQAER